jgi:hypothetical protein
LLRSIHARDVALGRTDGFLPDQLLMNANPVAILLILAGLHFSLASPRGRRFRMLGWTYLTTLAVLSIARGRGYYLMPSYPMLIAGGAVWLEAALASRPEATARRLRKAVARTLIVATVVIMVLTLPTAPVNSWRWNVISALNDNLKGEIGWPEPASRRVASPIATE